MKATVQLSKCHEKIAGVDCSIWEGLTENGNPIRIFAAESCCPDQSRQAAYERELAQTFASEKHRRLIQSFQNQRSAKVKGESNVDSN